MSDKGPDTDAAMRQMLSLWQEGAQAFVKANMEIAENIQKNFSQPSSSDPFGSDDPMKAWQAFMKSWAPAWDPSSMMDAANSGTYSPNFMKQMNAGFGAGKETFFAMMDPSVWTQHVPEQLREILDRIAAGPRFADLATPQLEAAASWREMQDYQSAMRDFATVIQKAWTKTYARYSENHSIDDLQTGDINDALKDWLKIANEELLETQRSSEFLDAQKRMMRAGTEIQARQRDIAEAWSANFQMPTRTEVDDLSRMVHELRREVRTLKREVAALRSKKPG